VEEDRIERIRRTAANQVAVCKEFAQKQAASRIPMTDEEWDAIEVLREPDHAVSRKRGRSNHTWNTSGRVKRLTIKRMVFERKLKEAGMTVDDWRKIQLPKAQKPAPKSILIKREKPAEE